MTDLSARLRSAAASRADTAIALLRDLIAAQPAGEAAVQARIADGLRDAGAEVSSLRYPVSYTHLTLPTIYSV